MAEEKTVRIPGETKKLDSREDVADIVKQIEECDGLATLQLSGNSFGIEATKAIGEALASKPHFSRALWSDMFVSRLKSEIPQSLIALSDGIMAASSNLTELDLSDNAFGPTGVEPIMPLLTSRSFYSIKVLKFNNNGLGIKGGTFLSKALLQCHEEAQSAGAKLALEVFIAGRNRLENEGAKALSQVFEAMGSLVQVSMPQNGIDSEGICVLASAFKNNSNLEVIDLNDNTFTEAGSRSMAEVLPRLPKLRVINFGDCLVRPEGACAIADAIKDGHQQLEELNLSFGELDRDAGLAVAEALANKRALKTIDLNGNDFGGEGIELLRNSLEAKGHGEALGSFSDDEGLEDEDEDDDGDERGDDGDGDEIGDDGDDDGDERGDDGDGDGDERGDEKRDISNGSTMEDKRVITIKEYLHEPNAENLVALGENRVQILLDHLASSEAESKQEKLVETVALFVKVTNDYYTYLKGDSCTREIIDNVIDALLEPHFQDGLGSLLVSEILVHLGLVKSEDKNFAPPSENEGPAQALVHVAQSSYFTKSSADILIAFFTKPSPALTPFQNKGIVYNLLQTLHTQSF